MNDHFYRELRCARIALILIAGIYIGSAGVTHAEGTTPKPTPPPAVKPAEDVYFKLNLDDPKIREVIESRGAKIVEKGPDGALAVEFVIPAEGANNVLMVALPFSVRPLRGNSVVVEAMVRGENVSKPTHPYNGVKCQVAYFSQSLGKQYKDEGGICGTFPWRKTSAQFTVLDDAAGGEINLGLQESTGTVWISDVKIKILARKPVRPAPVANLDQKTTKYRGFMSPSVFNEQDFPDMKAWGANCVRWHLDGSKSDQENYGPWFEGKFEELEKALNAAQANGIKLVIDLHLLPGGRLPDGTMRLALEKKYQDELVTIWERIVKRYKDHPALWAYDLINEPVQNVPSPEGVDDWLAVQVRVAKAIRKIDSKTPIMIEADDWDSPQAFRMLQPVAVPNVIYQVHMYWPGEFTHQGVHTNQGIALGKDVKPIAISYPGLIGGRNVDKESLRAYLEPVREFQRAYNVRVYVGEFSAARWAPGGTQYLGDCISLFEEYGWDWAYHAFREWNGWSAEYDEQYWMNGMPPPEPAAQETSRAKMLKAGMRQGQPAATLGQRD